MPIVVKLDELLAIRKVKSKDLAEAIGTSPVNLSRIKCNQIRGVRFDTLYSLCKELDCQPGDILTFDPDE